MGRKSYRQIAIPPDIYRLLILEERKLGENLIYRKVLGERTDIIQIEEKRYLVSEVVGQKIRFIENRERVLEESPLEVWVSRYLGGGGIGLVEDELKFEIKTEKVIDEKEQVLVSESLREKGFIGAVKFEW